MAKITPFRPPRAIDEDKNDFWEISAAEVELLLHWRQLPRDVQQAVIELIRRVAPG
jgi:hypothetical protein